MVEKNKLNRIIREKFIKRVAIAAQNAYESGDAYVMTGILLRTNFIYREKILLWNFCCWYHDPDKWDGVWVHQLQRNILKRGWCVKCSHSTRENIYITWGKIIRGNCVEFYTSRISISKYLFTITIFSLIKWNIY